MDALLMPIAIVWIWTSLGAAMVAAPAAALKPPPDRRAAMAGPAFVWMWAGVAVLVPAIVAIHGFNWATAVIVSLGLPAALWLGRHRGGRRVAFRALMRSFILAAVGAGRNLEPPRAVWGAAFWIAGIAGGALLVATYTDV